jgi:esterase
VGHSRTLRDARLCYVQYVSILHVEIVDPNGPATHWLAMTHGIFGSGANWRSIARKVMAKAPGWGVALIDLRGHGKSPRGNAPFTVQACADDLAAALTSLAQSGQVVNAVCGHSFGGKVVLALGASPGMSELPQRIMLDSNPGLRTVLDADASGVPAVLAMLEALPRRWPSRDAFVDAVEQAGHSRAIARWLGLSVNRVGDDYQLQLEVDAIRLMLEDYFRQDLWPLAATSPQRLDIVVAQRASTFSTDDKMRLAQVATANPHVVAHQIVAGHWLHVDAPEATVTLIAHAIALVR